MKARVVDCRYEKGSPMNMYQGCKGGYYKGYKNGVFHKQAFGWGYDYVPSKIIVTISLEGTGSEEEHDVWVDKYFKDHWGRITENRKNAILRSAPEIINVEEVVTERGYLYYKADEDDLNSWMAVAQKMV